MCSFLQVQDFWHSCIFSKKCAENKIILHLFLQNVQEYIKFCNFRNLHTFIYLHWAQILAHENKFVTKYRYNMNTIHVIFHTLVTKEELYCSAILHKKFFFVRSLPCLRHWKQKERFAVIRQISLLLLLPERNFLIRLVTTFFYFTLKSLIMSEIMDRVS